MIPVLFNPTDYIFNNFGIGHLIDVITCEVTEERNGPYELTLKYPTSGFLYNKLQKEYIILVKANDISDNQAFRIYSISVPINGIVTIKAQHISYDLANIAVKPFTLENNSPALVGNKLLEDAVINHHFTYQTDISSGKTYGFDIPKSIRACLGGSKGSMLDIWGGEFEWDNFVIKQHSARGLDRGVVIEYGKNLTKLDSDSSIEDAYTHVLPYGILKDDETGEETIVTLPEAVLPVNNTILQNGKVYIKDFTDQFGDDERVTEYALRTKANIWIRNHPLGVDKLTIKASFEPLSTLREKVALCDTVTVRHRAFGVDVKMKVIKTVFDTILEKYKSITLGEAKSNLAVRVNSIEEEIIDTKKEVDRFPLLLTSAISNATKLITGAKGGCVVLHTADDGTPYELLILDSENIEEAVNVWRWNLGGLGFSSHGYSGPYETAITADGSIVANFITSGTLIANIIKAGVLSSQDGSSYWNLDTGEVVLRAYATTEAVDEQITRIDTIEAQKMYRLVISSTNGNIFKNGDINTTLKATVYSWDEDITDTLDDNQFIWTRVSSDTDSDIIWNHDHFGGSKEIQITNEDVKVRATFYCDLIDTTTRRSLLGNEEEE